MAPSKIEKNGISFRLINRKEVELDGDEIISISLFEDGKRLFYLTDTVKEKRLHESNEPKTVIMNQVMNQVIR